MSRIEPELLVNAISNQQRVSSCFWPGLRPSPFHNRTPPPPQDPNQDATTYYLLHPAVKSNLEGIYPQLSDSCMHSPAENCTTSFGSLLMSMSQLTACKYSSRIRLFGCPRFLFSSITFCHNSSGGPQIWSVQLNGLCQASKPSTKPPRTLPF